MEKKKWPFKELDDFAAHFLKQPSLCSKNWFNNNKRNMCKFYTGLQRLAQSLNPTDPLSPNKMLVLVKDFLGEMLAAIQNIVRLTNKDKGGATLEQRLETLPKNMKALAETLDIIDVATAIEGGTPAASPRCGRKVDDLLKDVIKLTLESIASKAKTSLHGQYVPGGESMFQYVISQSAVVSVADVLNTSIEVVHRVWYNVYESTMKRLRYGRTLTLLEWKVADVALLYEPSMFLVMRGDKITCRADDMDLLLTLLQKAIARLPRPAGTVDVVFAIPAKEDGDKTPELYKQWLTDVWTAVHLAYCKSGRLVSSLFLQRRWHEARCVARNMLTSACVHRPPQSTLARFVAAKFPNAILHESLPWPEMFRQGFVIHESASNPLLATVLDDPDENIDTPSSSNVSTAACSSFASVNRIEQININQGLNEQFRTKSNLLSNVYPLQTSNLAPLVNQQMTPQLNGAYINRHVIATDKSDSDISNENRSNILEQLHSIDPSNAQISIIFESDSENEDIQEPQQKSTTAEMQNDINTVLPPMNKLPSIQFAQNNTTVFKKFNNDNRKGGNSNALSNNLKLANVNPIDKNDISKMKNVVYTYYPSADDTQNDNVTSDCDSDTLLIDESVITPNNLAETSKNNESDSNKLYVISLESIVSKVCQKKINDESHKSKGTLEQNENSVKEIVEKPIKPVEPNIGASTYGLTDLNNILEPQCMKLKANTEKSRQNADACVRKDLDPKGPSKRVDKVETCSGGDVINDDDDHKDISSNKVEEGTSVLDPALAMDAKVILCRCEDIPLWRKISIDGSINLKSINRKHWFEYNKPGRQNASMNVSETKNNVQNKKRKTSKRPKRAVRKRNVPKQKSNSLLYNLLKSSANILEIVNNPELLSIYDDSNLEANIATKVKELETRQISSKPEDISGIGEAKGPSEMSCIPHDISDGPLGVSENINKHEVISELSNIIKDIHGSMNKQGVESDLSELPIDVQKILKKHDILPDVNKPSDLAESEVRHELRVINEKQDISSEMYSEPKDISENSRHFRTKVTQVNSEMPNKHIDIEKYGPDVSVTIGEQENLLNITGEIPETTEKHVPVDPKIIEAHTILTKVTKISSNISDSNRVDFPDVAKNMDDSEYLPEMSNKYIDIPESIKLRVTDIPKTMKEHEILQEMSNTLVCIPDSIERQVPDDSKTVKESSSIMINKPSNIPKDTERHISNVSKTIEEHQMLPKMINIPINITETVMGHVPHVPETMQKCQISQEQSNKPKYIPEAMDTDVPHVPKTLEEHETLPAQILIDNPETINKHILDVPKTIKEHENFQEISIKPTVIPEAMEIDVADNPETRIGHEIFPEVANKPKNISEVTEKHVAGTSISIKEHEIFQGISNKPTGIPEAMEIDVADNPETSIEHEIFPEMANIPKNTSEVTEKHVAGATISIKEQNFFPEMSNKPIDIPETIKEHEIKNKTDVPKIMQGISQVIQDHKISIGASNKPSNTPEAIEINTTNVTTKEHDILQEMSNKPIDIPETIKEHETDVLESIKETEKLQNIPETMKKHGISCEMSMDFWKDDKNVALVHQCKRPLLKMRKLVLRQSKKVELPNIEEVRKINKTIMTAEVAPTIAQVPADGPKSPEAQRQSPERNDASGIMDFEEEWAHSAAAQEDPSEDLNQPKRGSRVKRRHVFCSNDLYGDVLNLMADTAKKYLTKTTKMSEKHQLHEVKPTAMNSTETHISDNNLQIMDDVIEVDSDDGSETHEKMPDAKDSQSSDCETSEKNVKDIKKIKDSTIEEVKSKTPANTYKNGDSNQLKTGSKANKYMPQKKPLHSKTKPKKWKKKKSEQLIEPVSDGLQEWERQKNLCRQYFHLPNLKEPQTKTTKMSEKHQLGRMNGRNYEVKFSGMKSTQTHISDNNLQIMDNVIEVGSDDGTAHETHEKMPDANDPQSSYCGASDKNVISAIKKFIDSKVDEAKSKTSANTYKDGNIDDRPGANEKLSGIDSQNDNSDNVIVIDSDDDGKAYPVISHVQSLNEKVVRNEPINEINCETKRNNAEIRDDSSDVSTLPTIDQILSGSMSSLNESACYAALPTNYISVEAYLATCPAPVAPILRLDSARPLWIVNQQYIILTMPKLPCEVPSYCTSISGTNFGILTRLILNKPEPGYLDGSVRGRDASTESWREIERKLARDEELRRNLNESEKSTRDLERNKNKGVILGVAQPSMTHVANVTANTQKNEIIENIVIRDLSKSRNDRPKYLFKRLRENPLVCAVVYSIVQDMAYFKALVEAKEALYTLSLSTGVLSNLMALQNHQVTNLSPNIAMFVKPPTEGSAFQNSSPSGFEPLSHSSTIRLQSTPTLQRDPIPGIFQKLQTCSSRSYATSETLAVTPSLKMSHVRTNCGETRSSLPIPSPAPPPPFVKIAPKKDSLPTLVAQVMAETTPAGYTLHSLQTPNLKYVSPGDTLLVLSNSSLLSGSVVHQTIPNQSVMNVSYLSDTGFNITTINCAEAGTDEADNKKLLQNFTPQLMTDPQIKAEMPISFSKKLCFEGNTAFGEILQQNVSRSASMLKWEEEDTDYLTQNQLPDHDIKCEYDDVIDTP